IAEGLSRPVEESGRMRQWRTEGGMLLIDDTYNSSPASLKLALELLGTVEWNGRRAAVLGDMLELGDHSRDEHFKIGREAVPQSAALLVAFGEEARAIAGGALEAGMSSESCMSYVDFDKFAAEAGKIFRSGDMVLIKGSRGMKMERIVNVLKELK
ncbi:MAG: cyanophycin synthetase, partial [bacterium]